MEKIHISTVQAMMLGLTSMVVTGHLLFIPVVLNLSGRDVWLALLAAALPTLFLGYIIASLSFSYPGRTLIQYSQDIFGKWLGKSVAALFVLYFFHDASLSLRGFGEFFTSAITPRTPIVVYFIAIIVLAVLVVKSGLEVLARTNQIFFVFMVPVGLLASVLTHKDKDYKNFLPVMEFGPEPMLAGMFSLVSLYSTLIVLGMVFANISQTKRLKKSAVITMIILIAMFFGPLTGPVALLGAERSMGISFPTFQILRDIKIGDLQRLDFIGIMLWSFGSFGKISLFLYAVSLGTAQWFGLKDYRSLVVPISALTVIAALLNSNNYVELYRFFRDSYPYYSTFIGFVLPLLLFGVSYIRRYRKKREEARDDI
jgi:spore germination protein KB